MSKKSMNDKSVSNLNPSDIGQYIRVSTVPAKVLLAALLILAAGFIGWCAFGHITDREFISGVIFPADGKMSGANVPNNGTVMEILVHKGDFVTEGQTLALIAVDKSYTILSAPYSGTVLSYLTENEQFNAFQDIVTLLPERNSGAVTSIIAYADYNASRKIKPGQEIQATPKSETREKVGFVRGRIISITSYPVTFQEAAIKHKNTSLVSEIFPQSNSVFAIRIELDTEKGNPDNLDWSFPQKEHIDMGVGTFCNIEVITRSRSVFGYLLENVQETRNSFKLWAE